MPIQRLVPVDRRDSRSPRSTVAVPGIRAETMKTFGKEADRLRRAADRLRRIDPDTRIEIFDAFARDLIEESPPFHRRFSKMGIPFLAAFLSRANLKRLLEASFPGGAACLRGFVDLPVLGRRIMAHPRGLIVHWIAGNVPGLGLISLVQGLLTGNANVIKLPGKGDRLLPELFARIGRIKVPGNKGKEASGRDLLECTLFVTCDREDRAALSEMSLEADVRMVWGGGRSVESIESLPRRSGAEDVVFGPKSSLAALGRKALTRLNMTAAAERLALDASRFDQQACTSPHVVFVERGGEVKPLEFARILAEGMEKALHRLPRPDISTAEAYKVVSIRGRYIMEAEVFSSKGTEWTVIYSEEEGLPDPVGSRVVFVRPVDDLKDLLPHIDRRHQTLGLMIDTKRAMTFAAEATARGIERITTPGQMHVFDHPWDGMLPLTRFVRLVSLFGPSSGRDGSGKDDIQVRTLDGR